MKIHEEQNKISTENIIMDNEVNKEINELQEGEDFP